MVQAQNGKLKQTSLTMYHFCTYFDQKYLAKGLALYNSLRRHGEDFCLWVLCFDDVMHDVLRQLNLPGVRLISQSEFEHSDAALQQAKRNRTLVEYYWTCTPALLLYVLAQDSSIDIITYLDADLYFFSSPTAIYDELGDRSVLIVPHRFGPALADKAIHGIYNVGMLAFGNDVYGLECLRWWRARCLEWCYARLEDGKFGDQKYLDDWTTRFEKVIVSQHKGVGLAPWNVHNYRVTKHSEMFWVDDLPVVFYHFHSFDMVSFRIVCQTRRYQMPSNLFGFVYVPYVRELQRAIHKVKEITPAFDSMYARYSLQSVLKMLLTRRFVYVGDSFVIR